MDKYQFLLLTYWVIAGILAIILEFSWDKKNKIDQIKLMGLGFTFIIGGILVPLYIIEYFNSKYGE